MRGSLSMSASSIASITFQSALNQPGGVAQANSNEPYNSTPKIHFNSTPSIVNQHNSSTFKIPSPGLSVFAYGQKENYLRFQVCNTICFVASLTVVLLLVSGLPLDHPLPMWILLGCMCTAVSTLALAYVFGAVMLSPNVYKLENVFAVVLYVWVAVVAVVFMFLTLRFVLRHKKKRNKSSRAARRNVQGSVSRA